ELHPFDDGGTPRSNIRLAGNEAQAARLLAALSGKWRTVHFAGHGFFVDPAKARFLSGYFFETAGQSPHFLPPHQFLLSCLVLGTDSGQSNEPTILTAEEVGSLDLRETDLVVLSACETGLGFDAGTDGVLGLTRAFLTAGSRSVVSSLWKVEDSATSLL